MVYTSPFRWGMVLCDSAGREDWRRVAQKRDCWGQAEVRREDGERGADATVGGKDSARREVGENVTGMVVVIKVVKFKVLFNNWSSSCR